MVDELITALRSIRPGTKVRVLLKSWQEPAELPGTLMEHPELQDDGRWIVKIRLKHQPRIDTYEVGVEILGVRLGWE